MADDERRLIERLQRRDEAAFNELVRRHQGAGLSPAVRMLGDEAEAEDVAQEVFVSVFKSIDDFRGDSALATWLYRIAMNHGKNRIKYLARRARDAQRALDERSDAHAAGARRLAAGAARPDQSKAIKPSATCSKRSPRSTKSSACCSRCATSRT